MSFKFRTGLTKDSFKHFVIGPGAIMVNFDLEKFDPEDESTWGIPLGATKGGTQFQYEQEYHVSEPDGTLGPVKNMEWLIAANGRIETSLMEFSHEVLMRLMSNFDVKSYNDRYDVFEHNGEIAPSQYTNIALIAELIGSRDPIIIILENARATTGMDVDMLDGKDDVVVPVTFEARFDGGEVTKVPVKILYPKLSGGLLLPPVADPVGGNYDEPIKVTLTAEEGAEIIYTTDGSTPTASVGEKYTGAIDISETLTLKAVAVRGSDISVISTNVYKFDATPTEPEGPETNEDSIKYVIDPSTNVIHRVPKGSEFPEGYTEEWEETTLEEYNKQ